MEFARSDSRASGQPRSHRPHVSGGAHTRAVPGPHWRRTASGLYVRATADRGVVEQRILEEASRLPPGGAVTGWAALRLHGAGYFDGLAPDGRSELPVPLVVPAGTSLRPRTGSTVHRERHGVGEVTAAPRAAFDAARRAKDLRDAVVVLDMALSSGVVTPTQLCDDLTARSGWSGRVTVARTRPG